VVVLGAGFDTLCAELKAASPGLGCFEIDHPATQAVKRAATPAEGVVYIAADLARQELAALLLAHPQFRAGASTLFVAEGLLMYVPPDAVDALFAQMAIAAPACQVAFTWLEPQADGRPNFRGRSRLVDAWLRWRGEPFLSGMARAALSRFLADQGFALQAVKASCDLVDGECAARRPIDGEYIALASAARQGGRAPPGLRALPGHDAVTAAFLGHI
jgi:methyltransferase (TIGR00027 family)